MSTYQAEHADGERCREAELNRDCPRHHIWQPVEQQATTSTYAEQIVREISDVQAWGQMGMAGTDFTITYRYPDAPDEVHHLRIARVQSGLWELMTLSEPHGKVDESAPFPRIHIQQLVMDRCRKVPGAFAGSAPTLAFIKAFFEID